MQCADFFISIFFFDSPHYFYILGFWYMCFLYCSELYSLSAGIKMMFWYMRICTVPNRLFICYMNYICFGICSITQLRTCSNNIFRLSPVLVYAFMHNSEPYSLSAGIKMLFGYMYYLYSSEPYLNRIRKVSEFWYMCFWYSSKPIIISSKVLVSFWYMQYLYSSEPCF